jgi:hypothetical protein
MDLMWEIFYEEKSISLKATTITAPSAAQTVRKPASIFLLLSLQLAVLQPSAHQLEFQSTLSFDDGDCQDKFHLWILLGDIHAWSMAYLEAKKWHHL